MFTRKFSDKHLRLGTRTWRPPDRDEIYRQRYLAASVIDPSQHVQPFNPGLQQSLDKLETHQPDYDTPQTDVQTTQTRSRSTSLNQRPPSLYQRPPSQSVDHSSERSRSQKPPDHSSQRAASLSESLNDAHFPHQSAAPDSNSLRRPDSTAHQTPADSNFRQNISTSQSTPFLSQHGLSDPQQLELVSQNARQSQKEYANSIAQSDYYNELLREQHAEYKKAKERLEKACNAMELSHLKNRGSSEANLTEPSPALRYNNPELNNMYESKSLNLGNTPAHTNLTLGNTPSHNNIELTNTSTHNQLEPGNTPTPDHPELDNTSKHHSRAPSRQHFSENEAPRPTQDQAELHEQRLQQIHEQTRQQEEIHEQKLKEIRELESLLVIKEKEIELRVKQLEEALEVERSKCQEYTIKAKQLEEALEAEQLKCQEQIKIAQETADRAAHESIQRIEEERQRKFEQLQKESEEKQELARQEYEAERKRLEQAQIELEAQHKEEKRRETEARMLSEMERLRIEEQNQLDLEAKAIAEEKAKLAIRTQIQERDRKRPIFHPDQRRAELIASFQPIALWDFNPLPDLSYPPTPMSPRIVPEAVKKAASAQKKLIEKQQKQKMEEEARQSILQQRQNQEQESTRFKHATPGHLRHTTSGHLRATPGHLNASPGHHQHASPGHHRHASPDHHQHASPSHYQHATSDIHPHATPDHQQRTTPGQFRYDQDQHEWGDNSFKGQDKLPQVDEPLTRSARSSHMSSHPNPTSTSISQPQSTSQTGSIHQDDHTATATRDLSHLEDLFRKHQEETKDLFRKHQEETKKEDAQLASRMAAFENAKRRATASENLKPLSPLFQKVEDPPEAQARAAQLAAYFMAEQASSKSSRRKTPQIGNDSNVQAPLHNQSQDPLPASVHEHAFQSESAFQVYSTDHVPRYTHDVIKPIESSVVIRVDNPSPVDYLMNDPHGHEIRLRAEHLARKALIEAAEELGANAILCLSYPSPVLVDHPQVNFSATGIAVVLNVQLAKARTGVHNYSSHLPKSKPQSHSPFYESKRDPRSESNKRPVERTPPSEPFEIDDQNHDFDETQGYVDPCVPAYQPSGSYVPENQKVQEPRSDACHDGDNSFKSHTHHSNFGYNPTGELQHHNHRSPQPDNSGGASLLPQPPVFTQPTPKLTIQAPSDNSSVNEPQEFDYSSPQQNSSSKSSPASAYHLPTRESSTHTQSSPSPNIHAYDRPMRQDRNSVTSPGKSPVITSSQVNSSIPKHNTSGGKTERGFSSPHQNSHKTDLQISATEALPTKTGSDKSTRTMSSHLSHTSHTKKSSSTTPKTKSPIPSLGDVLHGLESSPASSPKKKTQSSKKTEQGKSRSVEQYPHQQSTKLPEETKKPMIRSTNDPDYLTKSRDMVEQSQSPSQTKANSSETRSESQLRNSPRGQITHSKPCAVDNDKNALSEVSKQKKEYNNPNKANKSKKSRQKSGMSHQETSKEGELRSQNDMASKAVDHVVQSESIPLPSSNSGSFTTSEKTQQHNSSKADTAEKSMQSSILSEQTVSGAEKTRELSLSSIAANLYPSENQRHNDKEAEMSEKKNEQDDVRTAQDKLSKRSEEMESKASASWDNWPQAPASWDNWPQESYSKNSKTIDERTPFQNEASSPMVTTTVEYLLSRPSRSATPFHFEGAFPFVPSQFQNPYSSSPPTLPRSSSTPRVDNDNKQHKQALWNPVIPVPPNVFTNSRSPADQKGTEHDDMDLHNGMSEYMIDLPGYDN